MNVTEMHEAILALAVKGSETLTEVERKGMTTALMKFRKRVERMRFNLDKYRRHVALQKRKADSWNELVAGLAELPWPCLTCGFEWGSGNPLRHCTGEFGCSMERLRCKSSMINPS